MSEPTAHRGRGRPNDNGPVAAAAPEVPSAQDMWLASQGSNLGNANAAPSGSGGLGLGGDPAFDYNRRGRTVEQQFPPTGRGSLRRAPQAYDNPNAAGTVSAPLSPSRLYAQLEIGRGPSAPAPAPWPAAFDQRGGYGAPGMPVHPPERSSRNVSATTRDLSMPSSHLHQSHTAEPASPLSTFAPFSPPTLSSSLHPSAADKGNKSYISPSALLSPAAQGAKLPKEGGGLDSLASSFGKLGVDEKAKAKSPESS